MKKLLLLSLNIACVAMLATSCAKEETDDDPQETTDANAMGVGMFTFGSDQYSVNKGGFRSITNYELDSTGRYHDIYFGDASQQFNNGSLPDDKRFNLGIITDPDHINDIVGDFRIDGYHNDASKAPDFTHHNLEYYNEAENLFIGPIDVDVFTISKSGNNYTFTISGLGIREIGNTLDTADFQFTYVGTLSQL